MPGSVGETLRPARKVSIQAHEVRNRRTIRVGRFLPFADIAQAHGAIGKDVFGNVAVLVEAEEPGPGRARPPFEQG